MKKKPKYRRRLLVWAGSKSGLMMAVNLNDFALKNEPSEYTPRTSIRRMVAI